MHLRKNCMVWELRIWPMIWSIKTEYLTRNVTGIWLKMLLFRAEENHMSGENCTDDLGGRSPPVKGVSSKAPHGSITTRLFTDCQGYRGRRLSMHLFSPTQNLKQLLLLNKVYRVNKFTSYLFSDHQYSPHIFKQKPNNKLHLLNKWKFLLAKVISCSDSFSVITAIIINKDFQICF